MLALVQKEPCLDFAGSLILHAYVFAFCNIEKYMQAYIGANRERCECLLGITVFLIHEIISITKETLRLRKYRR